MLVKDARILMAITHLHMRRHAYLKIPFSTWKRAGVYKEIEAMQERLASVDTERMQSYMSRERFIVFKANFLAFEHEVIDFVNLFHVRVFSHVSTFQRDLPRRKYWKTST